MSTAMWSWRLWKWYFHFYFLDIKINSSNFKMGQSVTCTHNLSSVSWYFPLQLSISIVYSRPQQPPGWGKSLLHCFWYHLSPLWHHIYNTCTQHIHTVYTLCLETRQIITNPILSQYRCHFMVREDLSNLYTDRTHRYYYPFRVYVTFQAPNLANRVPTG